MSYLPYPNGFTTQSWRRGSAVLKYAELDPDYNMTDVFPESVWSQRKFRKHANIPVAEDPTTGLLVPPWAYAAGDAVTFATNFVGMIDTIFEGKQKRVPVFASGAKFMGILTTPADLRIDSWVTLDDNPVATIDPKAPTDPAAARLHPFYWKPTATAGEKLAHVASVRYEDRTLVELLVVGNTEARAGGAIA